MKENGWNGYKRYRICCRRGWKRVYTPSQPETRPRNNEVWSSSKCITSHKAILDVHTSLMCLGRSTEIKVPDKGSDRDPEHHLSKIMTPAHSWTSPKRHHIGCHCWKLIWSGWTFEPTLRQKCIRRRENRRISMHRPCLRRHNRPGRKSITHHIVDIVRCSILGCRSWCRYHTFKKTRSSSVRSRT
jgi:hypothetical protein